MTDEERRAAGYEATDWCEVDMEKYGKEIGGEINDGDELFSTRPAE